MEVPIVIAAALKSAIEAGGMAVKTFELIFPERFAIMEMDREIAGLVDGLNTVWFQAGSNAPERSTTQRGAHHCPGSVLGKLRSTAVGVSARGTITNQLLCL